MAKSYDTMLSDYESIIQEDIKKRTQFIQDNVEKAWKRGVVIGISGGIDSAVVAALSVKALGPSKVLGLWMPCGNDTVREKDALDLAATLGFKLININIEQSVNEITNAVNSGLLTENIINDGVELSELTVANTFARTRMAVLYAIAGQLGNLVVGTRNRTEIFLGCETKGGDQMYDFNPIGSLVKAQIRILARALGIPEQIIDRDKNEIGQPNESETGLLYNDADRIILTGEGDPDLVKKVEYLHIISEHKRKTAPIM